MKTHIKLGKILGIEIGIHYSWLIIAVLITLSLGGYFGQSHPEWGNGVIWAMAVGSAMMFFAAIVIHEMSHALVARSYDIPVKSITLFALGGVAQMEKDAESAKMEFWIGIVGPITSAVIGGLCLGAAFLMGWTFGADTSTPLMAVFVWLGYINIALAVFNMVPGFPMDGGRVMRAAIWAFVKDRERATKAASLIGQTIAFGFIIFGIIAFFRGSGIGGLWIAFIGWFLLTSARASYAQSEMTQAFAGLKVRDLMTTECARVDPRTNLQSLVDDNILKAGNRCFLVEENGELLGLVTPADVRSVERTMWPMKTVDDVMRPFEGLHTAAPEATIVEALETMGRADVNQLPVLEGGRLVGMISRDRILNYLVARKELDM